MNKFNVTTPMNPFSFQGSKHINNVKEQINNFILSLETTNIVDILDKINSPNFNPDYKDENGDPILHLLINDRYLPEDNKLFILEYLIKEKKADVTIKNRKLQNILHLSLKHGLYKIVEYLLTHINELNCYDIDRNNYLNYLIDVTPLEDNELKFNNKDNYIDKIYKEDEEKIVNKLIQIYMDNFNHDISNVQNVTNIKKIAEIINDNFICEDIIVNNATEKRIFFKDPLFNYSINPALFYNIIIEKIMDNNNIEINHDNIIDKDGKAILKDIYDNYQQNIQNIINEINKYIFPKITDITNIIYQDSSKNEYIQNKWIIQNPILNITYYDLPKHEYKINYIKYDNHKNFDNKTEYKNLINDIIRKLKVDFYNNMLNGIKFGNEVLYYDNINKDIIFINDFLKKNEYVDYLYNNYHDFVNTIKNIKDVFHIDNNIKIYTNYNDYDKEKNKDNIFYNLINFVHTIDIIKNDKDFFKNYNKYILDYYNIYFNINDSKLIIDNYTNYLIIKFLEYINIDDNYYSKDELKNGDYDINKKIEELNELIRLMFDKDGIIDLINKKFNKNISYEDIKKKILDDTNNCTDNILYSSNYLKKNDIVIIKKNKNINIKKIIISKNLSTNNNFFNSILNHNKYNYNVINKIDYKNIIKYDKQKTELKYNIQNKIDVKKQQLQNIKEIYKNNFKYNIAKNKYIEEAVNQIDNYTIIDNIENYDINKECIYELCIFKKLYDVIISLKNYQVIEKYLKKENEKKKENDNFYKNLELIKNNKKKDDNDKKKDDNNNKKKEDDKKKEKNIKKKKKEDDKKKEKNMTKKKKPKRLNKIIIKKKEKILNEDEEDDYEDEEDDNDDKEKKEDNEKEKDDNNNKEEKKDDEEEEEDDDDKKEEKNIEEEEKKNIEKKEEKNIEEEKKDDDKKEDDDMGLIDMFKNKIGGSNIETLLNKYNRYRLIKKKGYDNHDNFKMDNIELFNNNGDVILFNSFFENPNGEYDDVIANVKISYNNYINDVIEIFSDLYEFNMNLLISINNDEKLSKLI